MEEHDTDGLLVSLEELLARASKQRRTVGHSELSIERDEFDESELAFAQV